MQVTKNYVEVRLTEGITTLDDAESNYGHRQFWALAIEVYVPSSKQFLTPAQARAMSAALLQRADAVERAALEPVPYKTSIDTDGWEPV